MQPVIEPGGEWALPVGLPPAPGQRVVVLRVDFRAAVFDDGSGFGDRRGSLGFGIADSSVIEALDAQVAFLKAASARVDGGGVTKTRLPVSSKAKGRRGSRSSRTKTPEAD